MHGKQSAMSQKITTFAPDKRNRWQDMRSLRMLRIY